MAMLDRKTPPALGTDSRFEIPQLAKIPFKNGTLCHTLSGGVDPVVQLIWRFPRGVESGAGGLLGFAALDLMRQGTKQHDAAELTALLDGLGSQISTQIGPDSYNIRVVCTVEGLRPTLELLVTMLAEPRYSERSVRVWKEQQKAAVQLRSQRAQWVATRGLLTELIEGNHPYNSFYNADDVAQLTPEAITQYHRTQLTPLKSQLYASGPENSDWERIVESKLGWLNFGGGSAPTPYPAPRLAPGGTSILQNSMQRDQASLFVGRMLPAEANANLYPLRAAVSLLGGYFGSRLMQNLREEKGYTYGISAGFRYNRQATLLAITAEVGNNYVRDSVKEVMVELRNMVALPPSEREFGRMRAYLLGALLNGYDGVHKALRRLAFLNEQPALGVDDDKNYAEALREMELSAIKEATELWLRADAFTLSVAGDREQFSDVEWCGV